MEVIETAYLTSEQKEIIFRLWNQEYPKKITYKAFVEFDSYLNNLTESTHCLLVDDLGEIEGWAVTFTRENER
jgi:hypothetical protein